MKFANYSDVDYAIKTIAEKEIIISKKEADMNLKINNIKEKYVEETNAFQEEVDKLRTDIKAYCKKNKEDFEKLRSKSLNFGTIGFRNTPPKVLMLSRKYTPDTAKELVKKILETKYIRTKDELDKDQILADYAAKVLDDAKLASVGLKIDNSEVFYCDVNFEALEAVPAEVSKN